MQVDVTPVIWHIATKLLIGSVVTGVGALVMYPIRSAVRKIKTEWATLKDGVESAKAELVHQRTNCLTTLQGQGEEQIKILGKCASTLEAIHLDQKETLGLIRGARF